MTEATPLASEQITQEDREAAADAVLAIRGRKNGDWQGRIRKGECDDGVMCQAFARHRLSATSAPAGVEGLREALAASLAKRSVPTMDPPWSKAFNAALDMVGRDTGVAAAPAPSGQEVAGGVPDLVWRAPIDGALPHLPDGKVYGWRTTSGKIYWGEGYPVAARKFALDSSSCDAVLVAYTTPPASGVTVPEGMKAHTEKGVPNDWDGGKVLLQELPGSLSGLDEPYLYQPQAGPFVWDNLLRPNVRIIAYTPAALSTPSATPGEEA